MSKPKIRDFFISYDRHDKQWAKWLAWVLEDGGFSVMMQAWDFRSGTPMVDRRCDTSCCQRVIAVLSENYLQSAFVYPKWENALVEDTDNLEDKIIPVRVQECQLEGVLSQLAQIDLMGVTEDEAVGLLFRRLKNRSKPTQRPMFPGNLAKDEDVDSRVTVIAEPAPSPSVKQDKEESPSTLSTLSPSTLSTFTFEVVTVDEKGKDVSRTHQEAECWIEDLGDGITLEMVKIPGGTFLMGSPDDEQQYRDREKPQHLVTVPPFFMGKYPITQAQWRAVAELPQVKFKLNPNQSKFKGSDRPVEKVYWPQATEFCRRLSNFTGQSYRLPSEAEWEYACRAGTTTPFHFGEAITSDLANYNGCYRYGSGEKGIYRNETTPVGSFGIANAFGLYDMHGNVWEWCEDQWHDSYEDAPSDGSAWLDPEEQKNRNHVMRGGSWIDNPRNCRSATRLNIDPSKSQHLNRSSFRVVCSSL